MTPEEARVCEEWGLPFYPSSRWMIEKMVALAPERADEFWAMFKHLSKDNALRMIEELQAEKEERKRKLPAQPLAVKLLVNRQSNQQLRADLDAELEREAKGRREV